MSSAPSTPTRSVRATTDFVSPGQATGPRFPILGTPGRSKFGSKSVIGSPSASAAAASREISLSPSRTRGTEDVKPSTSELGYASGLLRAGSATPSISPSESASNIGAARSSVVSRSVVSRSARRSSVAPYRPRANSRSPSPILSRVALPLFFSETENETGNDDEDQFDAMTCASNPINLDMDDDVQTLLATRGGKALPADSPRSTPTSKTPASSTENLPKFRPHPNGYDLTELRLIQDDLLLQLFSAPENKAKLEELRQDYGFNSVFELRKLASDISRRGLDSNEGKFFTTSFEDPRRSYPKKTVVNDPGNPFCLD